jgi:hypothetical protein
MTDQSPLRRVARSMTNAQRQREDQRAAPATATATATQPPADTFTLFSKLAPELQLEVWDQAASVPRMLIIQLRSCGCGGDFHFTLDGNNISPPRELRTCIDSHRIASKKYKPLFAASIFGNHVSHHQPPPADRLINPRPKIPISSVDTLYIVEADDHQFFQPKLRLFPHDISTQLLHYIAFDAELLRRYSTREFIWCFVWACNLQEVVLVQRIKHPMRTGPQDKFDFIHIRKSEVDPLIRGMLETLIRDEVSTPPPKAMFEMYFGQEIKPRDMAGFKAPTFKFMGITKGGERL